MKRADWRRPDASPLVCFDAANQLRSALHKTGALEPNEKRSLDREISKGLVPVVSCDVVALTLGISSELVRAMSIRPKRYYRRFKLPKASGGTRTILTPRVFLKVVQWWILDRILTPYAERVLPNSVCAFRPGRCTLDAAKPHVGARFLLRCDLADFFGSVSKPSVRRIYEKIGYGRRSAELLSDLTTVDDALPQGAPTSPALANVAFARCDTQMEKLAAAHSMTYTRYADDLLFSGETLPSEKVIALISRTVGRHGFRLNLKKTRVMGPNERRTAVGLVLSGRAQPPRWLRRRLRGVFHRAQLRPAEFVKDVQRLYGWASYIKMFDVALGEKYAAIAEKVRAIG